METIHYISSDLLSIDTIHSILLEDKKLALSEEAIVNIEKCRKYLDDKMEAHGEPIYGINTGFGSLCNVEISKENLTKLQENLIKSHACGTGDEVPNEIVKIAHDKLQYQLQFLFGLSRSVPSHARLHLVTRTHPHFSIVSKHHEEHLRW